jgi:hypothetical protein
MKVRNKYLLIMAAVWGPCLTLAGASYALVLRPQMDHRRDLEVQVVQAKEHYARAMEAAKPQTQAHLTEQVGQLQERVSEFLVGFQEATELAFEIGNLARETKLQSFGMKPTDARAPESDRQLLAEKRLNVNFLARFTRFAAFLNALERHQPVVFVETFAISRPQEANAEPRVDMGLAVLVEKPQGD